MRIEKYGDRNWAVYDNSNCLVCVTVYKKGAKEVVRRLSATGSDILAEANINYDGLTRLTKELKTVNRNFNQLVMEIKATESTPTKAVL
jgi:uncharacterized protein YaaR (DUF327 family)